MTYSRTVRSCVDCSQRRPTKARGLCETCWYRHWKAGTLLDFERLTRPRDELLADWRLLQSEGYTRAQAAERLGITKKGLEKAIERETQATARDALGGAA